MTFSRIAIHTERTLIQVARTRHKYSSSWNLSLLVFDSLVSSRWRRKSRSDSCFISLSETTFIRSFSLLCYTRTHQLEQYLLWTSALFFYIVVSNRMKQKGEELHDRLLSSSLPLSSSATIFTIFSSIERH